MSESLVTWVYAVLADGAAAGTGLPCGVAGEPVRVVSRAGLCAAVGSVDAGEVSEEAMRRNLGDATWVERAVRGHHGVVAALFQGAPTVPFRLATVYHDDQRVRDMLAHRRRELAEALSLVGGRSEWGVQALTATTASERSGADPAAGGGRPGTSYLLRRKAERSAREAARRSAADAALTIHSGLDRLAAAARQSAPGRLPAGQRGQMVLNACYLVADQRRDEFTAAAHDLAERHLLRVRVTGPWPAYSFVELGKEEE
jgi:hypothetical protein